MTTEEYLIARKSADWNFNKIVSDDAFDHVGKIHPLMQKKVKEIVEMAKNDTNVRRIIIFGSSTRYDCDITSDLDICIDWNQDCYDQDGVLMSFTSSMRSVISRVTRGRADVVNYEYLNDTMLRDAVEGGVVVYEHNVQ
ncbi:MAG: nucleotidyltransferase domain-containing protein [Lachnospiraceae bacterium]|nr:nucleotidyltransferase domain-containing protein [Lachnospiraceae bacterium]